MLIRVINYWLPLRKELERAGGGEVMRLELVKVSWVFKWFYRDLYPLVEVNPSRKSTRVRVPAPVPADVDSLVNGAALGGFAGDVEDIWA